EEVTRDVVLGQRAGERAPDAILCVADATNLRLVLRLVLELKRIGRPLVLALNMIDIARKQGCEIDVARLSDELGIPVIPTVAVRRGGTDLLCDALDALCAPTALPESVPMAWHTPSADEIRAGHHEAERILEACAFRPGDARFSARLDRVLLHPVLGLMILL